MTWWVAILLALSCLPLALVVMIVVEFVLFGDWIFGHPLAKKFWWERDSE